MTTVTTSDKKRVRLTEAFETRWLYAATVASHLSVEEVPVSLTEKELKRLMDFDEAIEEHKSLVKVYEEKLQRSYMDEGIRKKLRKLTQVKKTLLLTELSTIQSAAALFDPLDDEWRLYADIDEFASNQRESYLRVGAFLRQSAYYDFIVPGLPEVATDWYNPKSELRSPNAVPTEEDMERRRIIVQETEWISLLVGILYMIFRSEGRESNIHHYKSYAAHVRDGAHLVLVGQGEIEQWGKQFAPEEVLILPDTKNNSARYERDKNYSIWLRLPNENGELNRDDILREWYARADLRGRWRLADAAAGIYRPRRQYINSASWIVGMDDSVPSGERAIKPGPIHIARKDMVSLTRAGYSIHEGKIDFIGDKSLMGLILVHLYKTRDRSLSPASLGLGALILDLDPEAAEFTRKRKRTYEYPMESVAIRYLHTLFLQECRWSLILENLGADVLSEIVAALIDWMLYIQRKYSQEVSIDAGEPTLDELEGLHEDMTHPLPESIYDYEDEEPEGDASLHDELYEVDEEYRAISDLADEALTYL